MIRLMSILAVGVVSVFLILCSPDHSTMNHDAPYDVMFIDDMIKHHNGAVAMAQEGLQKGVHQEVKDLSASIKAAQSIEVDSLNAWRNRWYPGAASGGMNMPMGAMTIDTNSTIPFDSRFIKAMISHHKAAIMMCGETQSKAKHTELMHMADSIVTGQSQEILQMKQWHMDWYGTDPESTHGTM